MNLWAQLLWIDPSSTQTWKVYLVFIMNSLMYFQSRKLPPHCDCDLKINVEEGAKLPAGLIYLLSTFKLKTLWTRFIQPSNSLFGASVLFIKKKDWSLWLCIDFQHLNAITQKDKYPLPLTSELLDTLSKAKIFTKIDLKHAYHLVRIAARDEPITDLLNGLSCLLV